MEHIYKILDDDKDPQIFGKKDHKLHTNYKKFFSEVSGEP